MEEAGVEAKVTPETAQPCGRQLSRAKRTMAVRTRHRNYLGMCVHTLPILWSKDATPLWARFPTCKMKAWRDAVGTQVLCKAVPAASSRWRTRSRLLSCGEGLS